MKSSLGIVLAVAFLSLSAHGALPDADAAYEISNALKGQPAPNFAFETPEGQPTSLDALKGQRVVVVFSMSATGCGHHQLMWEQIPLLLEEPKFSDVKVVVVPSQKPAPPPVAERSVDFQLYTNEPDREKLAGCPVAGYVPIKDDIEGMREQWGVYGTPAIYIVDRAGNVAFTPTDHRTRPWDKKWDTVRQHLESL